MTITETTTVKHITVKDILKITNGYVDITDPYYDMNANYPQGQRLPLENGWYLVTFTYYVDDDGFRHLTTIDIIRDGVSPEVFEAKYAGTVCVDTGMVGVFDSKPDYSKYYFTNYIVPEVDKEKKLDKNYSVIRATNSNYIKCEGLFCVNVDDGAYMCEELFDCDTHERIGYSLDLSRSV